MAWLGQPLRIEELLFKTEHGLVDQSLHARLGAETTNGDGFGVGWYGAGRAPGVYRSTSPAWAEPNLRHLAAHIESPLFLAHVRASSGSAVQQSNCHPFSHGPWLFVHNGLINDFPRVRRDLLLALDERAVGEIEGSSDSEVIFHLALARGLDSDPIAALESAVGLVERTLRKHHLQPEVQASMGMSNGEWLWAVRYSSVGRSRTLFRSEDADAVRRLHPPRGAGLPHYREDDHVVVSEPLTDLPGAWQEIPEATALTVMPDGQCHTRPFVPAPA